MTMHLYETHDRAIDPAYGKQLLQLRQSLNELDQELGSLSKGAKQGPAKKRSSTSRRNEVKSS